MSALLQREPPVRKIEALLTKAEARIALLTSKVGEIDGGEDPGGVVAAEAEVARAVAERLVLEKALSAARTAARKAAEVERIRLENEKRERDIARAEKLRPRVVEAGITFAKLMGELVSVCERLPGHDAAGFHPTLIIEAANSAAARSVKPKTTKAEDAHGRVYDLVVDTRIREVAAVLQCPAVEIE